MFTAKGRTTTVINNDTQQNTIELLNQECFCVSLDRPALRQALETELGSPELFQMMEERCPHVFAAQPVFVSHKHLERMAQVVKAVETVVALPAYQRQVLEAAPEIARIHPQHTNSVFFGYDFHLTEGQLGLIEINTNAGGAMLNTVLARAQRSCCEAMDNLLPGENAVRIFEENIVAMFRQEWQLAGYATPLKSIAIVDESPQQQFLYPEFLLFQALFQRHGIHTVIADPAELKLYKGQLWHNDVAIDLVYNRLTDFYLEAPGNAVLREAYSKQAVVLTPHPQAHALYADKSHLVVFSDAEKLQALGVDEATKKILLDNVPRTEIVTAEEAERLWSERKQWFFKPMTGYGSRAAYRGDKLTTRVWQEILQGDYVAQAIIKPGERTIDENAVTAVMKFDLRNYTYHGQVQWVAARLYQGQTTNFRTLGGGFAPVYSDKISPDCSCATLPVCQSP